MCKNEVKQKKNCSTIKDQTRASHIVSECSHDYATEAPTEVL